jgi:hypothetical protein
MRRVCFGVLGPHGRRRREAMQLRARRSVMQLPLGALLSARIHRSAGTSLCLVRAGRRGGRHVAEREREDGDATPHITSIIEL